MTSKKGMFLPIALTVVWGCAQSTSPNWYQQNIAASFFVDKWRMTAVDGTTASDKQVNVSFGNPDIHLPVSGGTVTMNSTMIPYSSISNDSIGYTYQLDSAAGQSVPILFNGSPLVFSVSGSSQFAALTDSITFPNEDMNVTAPAVGAKISKSSDLTVRWDYVPGGVDSITLIVFVADDSDSVPLGNEVAFFTIGDNGSLTVPASTFSSFPAGEGLTISVKRYNEKYGVDPLGRRYLMESSTVSYINYLLVP
jgi:hypothetical protein